MDEPLSNLDAKLRIELREDIRDIQRRLGITTIYVTHDQEEALGGLRPHLRDEQGQRRADRHALSRSIASRCAASRPDFVGTMNFLPARVENGRLAVGSQSLPFALSQGESAIEIAFRPENVMLTDERIEGEFVALKADVRKVTFLGREAHYMLTTEAGEIVAQVADPRADFIVMEGKSVEVRLPLSKIVLFDHHGDLVATGPAR